MKEKETKEMNDMDMERLLYQMVTLMRECMKMEKDMVTVYTGKL